MSESSMHGLIARLSRDLDSEGVVHALTGSVAAGLHGEPITSLDVDVVVMMSPSVASKVARKWERDLCADEYSLRQAAKSYSLATMMHFPSGLKVDISVLSDTPYHHEVLRRRLKFSVADTAESFWVVTAEDIILMKLLWRKESRSEKQWSNALGVARVQGSRLDWTYLRRWARELGVEDDLEQLAQEAGL